MGPPGVVAPAPALDPTLHYAVVVGIDVYPAIRNLRAARRDALDFQKWLKECGVPDKNIRVVSTSAKFDRPETALPRRAEVDLALRELFLDAEARVKSNPLDWPKTRLYLYLSGHGVAPNAREAMLLMANAQPGMLGDSVPCGEYMNFFEDAQYFHELVFFADCCRAVALQTPAYGPTFDKKQGTWGPVAKVLGLAAGFGALAYEPTKEEQDDDRNARGYFTQAVLEGLRGEAVDKKTGEINSTGLAKYVLARVAELTSKKRPGPQLAKLSADPATPIVFKTNVSVHLYKVAITFPVGYAGTAEVHSSNRLLHTWDGVEKPWSVMLAAGLYEVNGAAGTAFENAGLFRVLGSDRNVEL